MKSALLVIDVQNDFLPGGALAVPEGDLVIPVINQMADRFDLKVATQDWHPVGHSSFETLWPEHCVQGSAGAQFASALNVKFDRVIQKGIDPLIDSYSGFFDNEKKQKTELDTYLKNEGVEKLVIAGLATDYCVLFTVLDGLELGYQIDVIGDGVRGVNIEPGNSEKALKRMEQMGARII